jgi:hypothetical protein
LLSAAKKEITDKYLRDSFEHLEIETNKNIRHTSLNQTINGTLPDFFTTLPDSRLSKIYVAIITCTVKVSGES